MTVLQKSGCALKISADIQMPLELFRTQLRDMEIAIHKLIAKKEEATGKEYTHTGIFVEIDNNKVKMFCMNGPLDKESDGDLQAFDLAPTNSLY